MTAARGKITPRTAQTVALRPFRVAIRAHAYAMATVATR